MVSECMPQEQDQKADNYGVIELSGENSIGMYLDQGAVGVNHAGAEIRTAPNNTKDGIIGVSCP